MKEPLNIQVELKPSKANEIVFDEVSESSSTIKNRVQWARKRQQEMVLNYGVSLNVMMSVELIIYGAKVRLISLFFISMFFKSLI